MDAVTLLTMVVRPFTSSIRIMLAVFGSLAMAVISAMFTNDFPMGTAITWTPLTWVRMASVTVSGSLMFELPSVMTTANLGASVRCPFDETKTSERRSARAAAVLVLPPRYDVYRTACGETGTVKMLVIEDTGGTGTV